MTGIIITVIDSLIPMCRACSLRRSNGIFNGKPYTLQSGEKHRLRIPVGSGAYCDNFNVYDVKRE